MSDWRKLKAHPAAEAYPLMVASDLESLARSIKEAGQLFSVILTDEKTPRILDGRNRIAAYKLLEKQGEAVKPRIETYDGTLKPAEYVRVVNWERMHLSPSQRAALAVLITHDDKLIAEAHGRKVAAGTVNLTGGDKGTQSASADANLETGRRSEIAAERMGVARTQVEKAAKVQKEDKAAFERIKTGESTVHAEYKKLSKREQKQAQSNEFTESLSKFFTVVSAFRDSFNKLNLEVRELPTNLNDEQRGRYLSAALDLEKQVRLLILKLQGR